MLDSEGDSHLPQISGWVFGVCPVTTSHATVFGYKELLENQIHGKESWLQIYVDILSLNFTEEKAWRQKCMWSYSLYQEKHDMVQHRKPTSLSLLQTVAPELKEKSVKHMQSLYFIFHNGKQFRNSQSHLVWKSCHLFNSWLLQKQFDYVLDICLMTEDPTNQIQQIMDAALNSASVLLGAGF